MIDVPTPIAYVSFDNVPAPKGASTHIQAFVQALAGGFGAVDLVTVGTGADVSQAETWPGVNHYELPAMGKSLIDRVLCFRVFLRRWLEGRSFEIVQFRSIFEGLPLLKLAKRPRLVFEVNGLPSIELKYRYPGMVDDRELMRKLVAQEDLCLHAADRIATPSSVTRQYLSCARGVPADKIRVIPNGVDLDVFHARSRELRPGPMRLLYFGTLASWQGIELGIRALAQLIGRIDVRLTIVGTGSGRQRDTLKGLAAKLGAGDRVEVLAPVPQVEIARLLSESDAVLVPLTLSDRNTVQGCCPLKALEGMASGVPVIATDLPVMRELGRDGEHFLLVRPGSVDHIAETVLRLHENPELGWGIARQARGHVETNYTWQRAGEALLSCYADLGVNLSIIS